MVRYTSVTNERESETPRLLHSSLFLLLLFPLSDLILSLGVTENLIQGEEQNRKKLLSSLGQRKRW